ncbi:MAG: gliding motility-associated ABC transporter substrate-binding protein GldG [Bacteroidetes bacterium]|nr:gliding motility-associated ABC transporter substrate-binding protein GldG [Bacteroidota bacterium]
MVKKETNKGDYLRRHKRQSLISMAVLIAAIVVLNVFSSYKHFRIDLTQDKRYTLGEPTRELLNTLDDQLYIKVYLEGELPAGFRKLKESTRELLDEMRNASNTVIDYDFIDPLESGNVQERNEIYQQLIEMGLEPVNLEVQMDGENTQKIIFPEAIIFYKNKQLSVKLLKQQIGVHPEEVLHNSIISLEYEISNTIRKLTNDAPSRIAFIEGHGELDENETRDIFNTLSEFYEVERINLTKYKVGILDHFDLLIIAKPDSFFNDLENFKIDQFIVKGGRVLWLVESLLANIDSMASHGGVSTTMDYDLNLQNFFYHLGIRLNYNLVQDIQCHLIPVLVNQAAPQQDFRPWVYYPLVFPNSSHPIVNNLNACLFQFASSMDTLPNKQIKKTVLLTSSELSRMVYNPARLSLAEVNTNPDERMFNKGKQILGVLLEGTFNSYFEGLLSPATLKSPDYGKFQNEGIPTKMIFISDGDVIANQQSRIRDQYFPLGYDRFSKQTFGNKNLILNAVDYLLDDSGLMTLRSKQFKLRLLDKSKIKKDKVSWQLINMVLPVVFIILFGLLFAYFRKTKFAR